jgi:hypothetical protein
MRSLTIALPLAIAAFSTSTTAQARSCPSLNSLANSRSDAAAALLDCVAKAPPGGRLELAPGKYLLLHPITLSKPISLSTAGIADSEPPCNKLGDAKCARIIVDANGLKPRSMPLEIASSGVSLVHLIIEGSANPERSGACTRPETRPSGGGVRIVGSNFALQKSVVRNFTCYTSLEVLAGSKNDTIEDNLIGPNGDHRPGGLWSDGITIHNSENSLVRRNIFVDNTDVQLIFGGCVHCQVEGNKFYHTGPFARASFAELMLHAFPNTSGDYQGTLVTDNHIDCGKARRCGYGIMIGTNPWRSAEQSQRQPEMFGGTITRNTVVNALIGIDIDAPTGPVQIYGNEVALSGGVSRSDCGTRKWPPVNVAPSAVQFVKGTVANEPEGHMSTIGCLINRSQ